MACIFKLMLFIGFSTAFNNSRKPGGSTVSTHLSKVLSLPIQTAKQITSKFLF